MQLDDDLIGVRVGAASRDDIAAIGSREASALRAESKKINRGAAICHHESISVHLGLLGGANDAMMQRLARLSASAMRFPSCVDPTR